MFRTALNRSFVHYYKKSAVTVRLVLNLSTMIEKKPFERLPKDVTPVNYKLRLKPDLLAFTFDGHEIVSLKVNKPTNKIVLNSIDISIKKATLTVGEKTEDAVVSYCVEDETATLGFAESVAAGDAKLCIDFEGELNDKMKGFYHSKYFTPDGEERYGAVTQFESTDARRAFPCWDEPALKATFDVTLVVPEDRVALSNMPVQVEKVLGDGCKEVHYLTTPIMSTYLLAFVVGEYDYVEGRSSDGVLIRVYTPVGKKEQGQFALEVAVKTLPFYKDYFGIGFPLPKSDLIAIADFAAGAMENWGLVTYRETALLIDQKNSSSATKQWVALVVGHELAHQWFGNLVTMEWWTHLWLNEGFASWIEYLCVDYCHPEFDIWTQFVSSDYMRALELDALHNSHPIEVPVGHPDEVDEIFDTISYSKGASVIRMLHEFLGDEFFKKGLNIYLNRFKYSNAFTEDLWAALEESSGQPVGRMMTTWTKQMGFPVVQVSQRQEGSKRIITLKQEKFNADGSVDETDSSWYVPVSLCTASSPSTPVKKVLLLPEVKSVEVILDNVSAGEWVKVNPGTYGVYRTQYSADMLDTLLPAIKDKTLPPRDRLGLQNDVFALARAGKISSVVFLNVVKSFEQEDNYTVWNDLANNLDQLGKLLQYTDIDDAFRSFVCKLYQPIGEKMGWDPKENESHLDSLLRSLVVQCLAKSGDSKTITEAKKRFHRHCDGSCCLGADIRSPVYHTVLRDADEEVFDRVLKLHKEADLQEEKVRILRSLGSVKHDKLIQRCLQFAMSDEVRSQDTVFVIISATCSKLGRQMAWEFIKENWSELANRYSGGFLLSRLIMSTTYHFASNDMAKEVEGFFVDHPAPAAQRTIQQSCENIRLNATWRQRDESAIREWLAKNST